MIVHENGLLVDSIENKIHNAKDYTEKGLTNLEKAKEHHEGTKKKKWWVCMCISMAAAVVFSPILVSIIARSI